MHVQRLHDVQLVGSDLQSTCQVCGHVTREPARAGLDLTKQIHWWASSGGALAECPRCTQRRRDELYPLTD